MLEVSAETQAAIRAPVARDLEPSPARVQAKVFAGIALGSAVSLSLCGQFGVGFTPWAKELQSAVVDLSIFVPCMMLCGMIFALFPVAVLRLLCRPLEFRAIMRRRPFSLFGWLLGFEVLLAWHSGFRESAADLAIWFAASVATFWLLGRSIDALSGRAQARLALR